MKLIFRKHTEFSRLKNYFRKIEALADKMGLDVDELVNEKKNSPTPFEQSYHSKLTQKRNQALENFQSPSNNNPDSKLKIL